MLMLVDCSNCRTPLQLPPGEGWICCVVCQVVTHVAKPPLSVWSPYAGASSQQYYPPSPYNHAPPGQPPSVHGRKRAVICGISYRYSRHELKGCINDAKCMKFLLINRFKFPESSILMLTGNSLGSPFMLIACLVERKF
ncbi:hypothetical protein C3L33_03008, partial [Rhododendron williamsianum]